MIVNSSNLRTLTTAFSAAFRGVLDQAPSQWRDIATPVPSTTGSNEYGWIGTLPSMREWIGDRVINGIRDHGYSIKNKPFEMTVAVPRPVIEDDQYGVYTPMMEEMGRAAGAHPDQLVFTLLKNAHATLCYDGQYFFDTDHPVIAADGSMATQSNLDNNSGSGTRWYLLDNSRAIKPLIFQDRKKPNFVSKTAETDDNVFNANEFLYGVDSRCNVGFSFWQLAYCSRKTLDEANIIAAYTEMTSRTGDYGRPLGLKPTHLVVSPSQKFAAMKLVNNTTLANGEDNVLKGLVVVLDSPWLV